MARLLRLYGFWRSMAAYRVRVALNLKGVAYEETPIDLDGGGQLDPAFLALNPEGAVPTLVEPGGPAITQSMAILEYLDERWPEPPLLPPDPLGRARVRGLAGLVVADTHPLLTPRVQGYLRANAGFDASAGAAWSRHWVNRAAAALEARLARDPETGDFCHGDGPTIADACVASLFVVAKAFGHRLRDAPTLEAILARCEALDAFRLAEPKRQAGAPG